MNPARMRDSACSCCKQSIGLAGNFFSRRRQCGSFPARCPGQKNHQVLRQLSGVVRDLLQATRRKDQMNILLVRAERLLLVQAAQNIIAIGID